MEVVSASSGVAGLVTLGITVCQGLLDYYDSWKHAETQVAHMYASIEALSKTLKLLESTVQHESFDRDIKVRVEECIKSAEMGFQSLRRKLDKVQLVSSQESWKTKATFQIRRTMFPFKESTLARLKELGNELRDDLSLALSLLQIDASTDALRRLDLLGQSITEVSTGVGTLKEQTAIVLEDVKDIRSSTMATSGLVDGLMLAQATEFKRKVCDWLSPLSKEFQRKQMDTFNIENRQDGISQLVFETSEFKDWLSGRGTTLWCSGIPGAGKTVLASCIINHVQGIVDHRSQRLAYMYVNYKDSEKQAVPTLLMSLVSQLASLESLLPEDIIACYEAHGSGTSQLSIGESTHLLRGLFDRCAKVFLVIDAFDEMSEECRGSLTRELQHWQPQINLLITSRDLPNIESQLADAIKLKIQINSDDILQYVRKRLAESDRIQAYARKDPSLCDHISTTIASRSNGMFLQARLHVDALVTTTTLRKLKETSKSLPTGLDNTYDETLGRVQAQHLDQANLARKALYWVFNASRPLTMIELQHALAVETGDRDLDEENIPDEALLLSVCNGLLVYEKIGGFLTLVHHTFQEYMERKADILFPEAELEMARISLTYLMFDEFAKGPCRGDQKFEDRLQRWPLLRYAVFNWGHHVRYSAEGNCEDLIEALLSDDAKISASVQVLSVHRSKGFGYSYYFPKDVHALWLASFYGLANTAVRLLARDKESVLSKTTWGDTALHQAAGCGHVNVVLLLLDQGANVHAKDSSGNTPLHVVLRSDMFATESPNSTLLDDRYWLGQRVLSLGDSLALKLALLDRGADISAVNLKGESPLHVAVCDGHHDFVKTLLDRGADNTLETEGGWPPLSMAAERGFVEVARILLEYNLEKQIQTGILDVALQRAVPNDHLPVFSLLISKAPRMSATDAEGRNLLHTCAFGGALKCLEYLLKLGFDLHALDKQRRTCLHHAKAWPQNLVDFLLRSGLDPAQPDIDGWTPLYWAAKRGRVHKVRRHLKKAGFPEDRKEWIPYIIAMFHGHPRVAALLKPPGKSSPEFLEAQLVGIYMHHPNIICDGCDLTVYGTRYHCLDCANFDYCFKCFRSARISHPRHEFKSIYRDDEEGEGTEHSKKIERILSLEAMMMATAAPA